MLGAGFQPAGSTAAGFGAPSQDALASNTILEDPALAASTGSRLIDPLLQDYAMQDGRILGMSNTQQLVLLAIANVGPALQRLDRLDRAFEKGVESIIADAFAPLAARKLVEFQGVTVRMNAAGRLNPGQAVVAVNWRDLTTNEVRSEFI